MNYINITVRGKMARAEERARVVCGNSDYTVCFDFDEEWAEYAVKTARFVSEDGSYTDVQFEGSDCTVPILRNTRTLLVGVFAGNLRTTTAAVIHTVPCITDPDGTPADPTPDVYAQLMERFNAMEAPAAVLYTEQNLTDEQKAQARDNIGVTESLGMTGATVGQVPTVKSVDRNGVPTEWEAVELPSGAYTVNLTMDGGGNITADKTFAEIKAASDDGKVVNAKFSGAIFHLQSLVDSEAIFAKTNANSFKVITVGFVCTSDNVWSMSQHGFDAHTLGISGASVGQIVKVKSVNASGNPTEWEAADMPSGGGGTDTSLGVTGAAVGQLIKIKAVDADGKPTAWEPVDDRLPNISPSDEGQALVVKPIGEFEYGYGFARIPNISDFINLGITDASPGKLAKVKFVDDFGQPTEWEAVDMPSGGEREWIKIGEVTTAEDTTEAFYMKFTKDINGNSLSLKGVLIIGTPLFSDTKTHNCVLQCNDLPNGNQANYFLNRPILRNKQTFTIYSEFLRDDGVNSVVVTVSNTGNVKQLGGVESYINTWSPNKEALLQFPMRGIDFGVMDSGLLAGSKFEFWGGKA